MGSDGTQSPFIQREDTYETIRFSPNGERVVVSVGAQFSERRDSDIWVYDADTGAGVQLTFGHSNRYPVWMPDGDHVLFWSDRDTSVATIWYLNADGSQLPVPLVKTDANLQPRSVHSDGTILATEMEEWRIVLIDPSDGTREVYTGAGGSA